MVWKYKLLLVKVLVIAIETSWALVAHTFNPTLGGRGKQISIEASLVYIKSSRTVRATKRNPYLQKQQTHPN